MTLLLLSSAFAQWLPLFGVLFGPRRNGMQLAELTAVEAVLMVILVYSLLQVAQYGVKKMRHRPFVAALRKQQPAYYTALPQHLQRQFEKRVADFLLRKTFIPRGQYFEVTLAMRVQIAAAAVQLTFGLEPVYLSHFSKILLYPDRYYSTISKRYHCGEVNPRGYIVLSWKDFEAGYRNNIDGFNLGLHEMAHALHLENIIQNNEHSFLDTVHLRQWKNLAAQEMQSRQKKGPMAFSACRPATMSMSSLPLVRNRFSSARTILEPIIRNCTRHWQRCFSKIRLKRYTICSVNKHVFKLLPFSAFIFL